MTITIQEKIDQTTKGLKHPEYGDKVLELIHLYTTEFLEIFPKQEGKLISANAFFQWFRHQEKIKKAYELLLDNRLICEKDNGTAMYLVLEFVVSNSIHFLIGAKIIYGNNKTRRAIVPLKKHERDVTKALKVLSQKIKLHQGIYSKYESKQYLLRAVIDDILTDQENWLYPK